MLHHFHVGTMNLKLGKQKKTDSLALSKSNICPGPGMYKKQINVFPRMLKC